MVVGKMNRAAREDTGFTWMVSILIIVFILIIYLIFGVSGAYGAKKLGQDREIVLKDHDRIRAIETSKKLFIIQKPSAMSALKRGEVVIE